LTVSARDANHHAIEVRLRAGHSLLVESGFEAGHLRALLALLETVA
jgi:hypothetical protein